MGYCTGQTLDDWMKANREAINPGLAAEFVRQAAAAIGHGHRRGVVHRDMKPGNIMVLDEDEEREQRLAHGGTDFAVPARDGSGKPAAKKTPTVRVLDFGLAGNLEEASDTAGGRIVAGSAAYMSPEQAAGEPTGPTCDVHALGAVLFKLLTGRTPYSEGDGRTRLLGRLASTTAPSPRQIDPTVPTDLAAICLKCLRKNPRQRYADAGELAADLSAYLEGRPVDARELTPWEELRHWLSQPDRIREAGAVIIGIHLFLPVWSLGGEIGLMFVDTSKATTLDSFVGMLMYLVGFTWPMHLLFLWTGWTMFRGRPVRWAMHLATNIAVIMFTLHALRGLALLPLPSPYYATHPGARWQVFWMLSLTAMVDVVALLVSQIVEHRVRRRQQETDATLPPSRMA